MPPFDFNGPVGAIDPVLVRQVFPAIPGDPLHPYTWRNHMFFRVRPDLQQYFPGVMHMIYRALQNSANIQQFTLELLNVLERDLLGQPRMFPNDLPLSMKVLQCLLVIAHYAGSEAIAAALHDFIIGHGSRILKTTSFRASLELAVDIFNCRPLQPREVAGCLREVVRGNPNVLRHHYGWHDIGLNAYYVVNLMGDLAENMHDFEEAWIERGRNMLGHPWGPGRRGASLDDFNHMRRRLKYGHPRLDPWDLTAPQRLLRAPISVNDYGPGLLPRRMRSMDELYIRRNHGGGRISQLAHIQAELQHGQADLYDKVDYLLARDATRVL